MNIIFDVDGTLLNIGHRVPLIRPENGGHKDWVTFRALAVGDLINHDVAAVYRAMHAIDQHTLIICTGRMESERNLTVHVLHDVYKLPRPELMLMREDKDFRQDHVVKQEMLNTLTLRGLHPDMAVDDRQQVVDMWRRNGVRCMQVAEGKF